MKDIVAGIHRRHGEGFDAAAVAGGADEFSLRAAG